MSFGLYGEYRLSRRSGINFSINHRKYQNDHDFPAEGDSYCYLDKHSILFQLQYNYIIAQGKICDKIYYEWYAGAGISSGYEYVDTDRPFFNDPNGKHLFKNLYGNLSTGVRIFNKKGWGIGAECNIPFSIASSVNIPSSWESPFKFSLFKKF